MANYYINNIDDICLFFWGQRINIIGSVFLALAIYSYIYKAHLNYRNKKQLGELIEKYKKLYTDFNKMGIKEELDGEHVYLDNKIV